MIIYQNLALHQLTVHILSLNESQYLLFHLQKNQYLYIVMTI